MGEFKDWNHCYCCGSKMTDEDHKNYKPRTCCNGNECGCMGLPIDPPLCVKCSKIKPIDKG